MFTFLYALVVWCFVASPVWSAAEPLWDTVCQSEPIAELPFCDESLSIEDRVDDYVNRVPVENQIKMMGNSAEGFDDLGIPSYQWWSEGLHGAFQPCVTLDGKCKCPTSFPAPTGTGNSFNTTLYRKIGEAIGLEGRAISNLRNHDSGIGDGLTYWSPTINLQRDPRWGRNQEVPGEDPMNVGRYAQQFVKGLQGAGENLQVAACCKHFLANSLEHWKEYSRHSFDARISEEDLRNYYLPPFEQCVQAGVVGIMCSYNAVNGVPACHNRDLLKALLREEWQFDGYIVTDCGALQDTISGHHYVADEVEASVKAVEATVNVNCGRVFGKGLAQAYDKGLLTASQIQNSFRQMARIQFSLGLFNSKQTHPQDDIAMVGSHEALALEAAQQAIVLLKNSNGILPINPDQRVVVIGPHAQGREVFLSNYHGDRCCSTDGNACYDCIPSPTEAIQKHSRQHVDFVLGCNVTGTDRNEIEEAVLAAETADVVILTVGLDHSQEGEELDRVDIRLPGLQEEVINEVLEVASEKTILVLIHGGAVALGESIISTAPAILSASYGGQAASEALASVLYGEYNPSGKLSATMYPASFVDDLPMTEMGLQVGVGRTYMYYRRTPEFSFGDGLSYSTWSLDWGESYEPKRLMLGSSEEIQIELNVTNEGPRDGSQSVLLFWRPLSSDLGTLRQKLADFAGTDVLKAGESQELSFTITEETFALWNDEQKALSAVPGLYWLEAQAAGRARLEVLVEILSPELEMSATDE